MKGGPKVLCCLDGEGGAGGAALLGNHNAFERLNAFLDLFAFAFEEADIDADGVARTELGEVFAQLRVMKLTNYGMHVRYSLKTHSGGASSCKTNCKYTGNRAIILERLCSGSMSPTRPGAR